jgi:hypothetical protein
LVRSSSARALNVVKLRAPSLLKNGIRPHSIIAISRPPSTRRMTGMVLVGAAL